MLGKLNNSLYKLYNLLSCIENDFRLLWPIEIHSESRDCYLRKEKRNEIETVPDVPVDGTRDEESTEWKVFR